MSVSPAPTVATPSQAALPAAAADPRAAPLVARLVAQSGAQWVSLASHDGFVAGAGNRVLFFSGDPVRFPESLDVAVVLPELQAALHRAGGTPPFSVGVVCRDDEDPLARRWASLRWPALVFLRDGAYVGCLPGMHDWIDFVARVGELLATPASRVPGVGIPVVPAGAGAGAAGCH